jgi:hypothetical protein
MMIWIQIMSIKMRKFLQSLVSLVNKNESRKSNLLLINISMVKIGCLVITGKILIKNWTAKIADSSMMRSISTQLISKFHRTPLSQIVDRKWTIILLDLGRSYSQLNYNLHSKIFKMLKICPRWKLISK